jgi:hypothetical protein
MQAYENEHFDNEEAVYYKAEEFHERLLQKEQ